MRWHVVGWTLAVGCGGPVIDDPGGGDDGGSSGELPRIEGPCEVGDASLPPIDDGDPSTDEVANLVRLRGCLVDDRFDGTVTVATVRPTDGSAWCAVRSDASGDSTDTVCPDCSGAWTLDRGPAFVTTSGWCAELGPRSTEAAPVAFALDDTDLAAPMVWFGVQGDGRIVWQPVGDVEGQQTVDVELYRRDDGLEVLIVLVVGGDGAG